MALNDKITEDLNKEMLNDIYLLKKRLIGTQQENSELQLELSKLRLALLNSNKRCEELEKKLEEFETKSVDFEKKNEDLEERNSVLQRKNEELIEEKSNWKDQYYQSIQMKQQENIWSPRDLMDEFQHDFKFSNGFPVPFQPFNSNNSSYFSQPEVISKKESPLISTLTNGTTNGHSNGTDDTNSSSTTLAMKLKQSQGNFFDGSTTTRASVKSPIVGATNGTTTYPKVVIKEPSQPLKNHNTRSLYVAGLYKGLAQSEVKKYFEKFGKILMVTVPPVVDNIVDGQKYLFIKFESCESVDKVLKQDYHTIKDVSVRTKPGKNV